MKISAFCGLSGVGRAALFSVLRRLDIVSEDRDSYNFYEAMGLYVEHVLRTRGILFSNEIQEGRDIVETLQQRWFMPRLCALHVARLYELSNLDVFHAKSCPILGPGALNFLKQLFPWEGSTLEDNATWQTHLKTTARRLHSEAFEVAVNLLGPDLARQL